MADKENEQEPSIEEILASIRQIIADDEEGGQEAPSEPEPETPPEDEPIELTERIEEEEDFKESIEVDLQDAEEEIEDIFAEPEPEPAPPPPPPPPPKPSRSKSDEESIFSDSARNSVLEGFGRLATQMPINRDASIGGISLEDIVREMLKPMLREWIDANLPDIIEKLVQKELEKLAQKALDD